MDPETQPTPHGSPGGAAGLVEPLAPHNARGEPAIGSRSPGPARWRRRALLPLAGSLLVLALGRSGVLLSGVPERPSGANRVIVVPLQNRTGDPSLDPLGRWAADWMIRGLTRTDRIEVMDAAVGLLGSGPAKGAGDRLGRVLQGAKAGLVVSGSFYRYGDSIQFQVHLTDADGGTAIPAVEPISGSVKHPQAAARLLGERVTGAVAAHLDPRILALNSDGSRPPSYQAYQAWVDGIEFYSQHDYEVARARLLYAASLDPDFITPLIWAAAANERLGQYAQTDSLLQIANIRRSDLLPFDRHFLDRRKAQLRGDRAAEYRAGRRMLEVAPASELALYLFGATTLAINHPGEALEALREIDTEGSAVDWDTYGTRLTHAYHLLGDYAGELKESRRVRQRRPELLRPLVDETRALAALGRTGEVLQLLDLALALPPGTEETPASVARSAAEELRMHGHAEAARQALDRALTWYRTRPPGERATEPHQYGLAKTLYRAGRCAEAEPLFRTLAERSPEKLDYLGHLGVVAACQGATQEAHRISRMLSEMKTPYLRGSNTFWRARIAAVAGWEETAVGLLSASFAQGQAFGLAVHPETDFEALQDRPAFRTLLRPRR